MPDGIIVQKFRNGEGVSSSNTLAFVFREGSASNPSVLTLGVVTPEAGDRTDLNFQIGDHPEAGQSSQYQRVCRY